MIVTTRATLIDLGIDLDVILGRVILAVVEPLGDGDGKVGEVDVLVLGAGPGVVATCSPSRSTLAQGVGLEPLPPKKVCIINPRNLPSSESRMISPPRLITLFPLYQSSSSPLASPASLSNTRMATVPRSPLVKLKAPRPIEFP